MGHVLANRNFARIWSGQLVSQIGDKFYAIALAVWIVDKTGSAGTMAVFLVASMVPGLVVAPFAGALVDRWSRKSLLIAADFVRGTVVAGVALLWHSGALEIWHIVAAAAAISVASAFFGPALSASLPSVVGEEMLSEANALSQLGGGLTMVLGPAFGALVLSVLGYGAVFAVNAATFVVSGVLILLSRVPSGAAQAHGMGLVESVAEGLRYVRRTRGVALLFAAIVLAHLAVGGQSVALPFLARGLSGTVAANLGMLEALLGAGMVVASVLAARFQARRLASGPFVALSLMGAGLCFAGLLETANVKNIGPFLACFAGVGAAVATASIFWTTLLQKETPDALRGRVFGLSATLGSASLPLGMALSGLALSRVRIGVLLGPLGAVLVLAGALLALSFRRVRSETGQRRDESVPTR